MSFPTAQFDHLVVFVTDIEQASRDFTELGFQVTRGGSHGSTENALVIFANQLVPLPELAKALPDGGKGVAVFMAEDLQFCRHYHYHQQKLVLILADYQMKAAFVADAELNMVACLTECMANLEFA